MKMILSKILNRFFVNVDKTFPLKVLPINFISQRPHLLAVTVMGRESGEWVVHCFMLHGSVLYSGPLLGQTIKS